MTNKHKVSKKCWHCGKVFDFYLTGEQIWELDKGDKNIQDILIGMTPGDRELFISGICGKCFDEMFLEGDEDDN